MVLFLEDSRGPYDGDGVGESWWGGGGKGPRECRRNVTQSVLFVIGGRARACLLSPPECIAHCSQQHTTTTAIQATKSMETTSPFPEKETSLLTLSRSELSTSKTTNNDDKDTLVLMQLPSSLVVSELQGARIIASPSQQACLVLNDKSYNMSRVETSNAYIMVPPSNPQERPCKRTKTDATLVPVTLLQPGGSGASFLQLQPKHLNLALLQELLQPHVLDPYSSSFSQNDEWTGRTCSSLAVDLQCSEPQVLDGLKRIQALGIVVSNDDNVIQYGFLSEEALLDAKRSIVATLMECDEFHDYAVSGISQQECIQQVLQRVGETYKYMEQVMKHTLQMLESDTASSNVDTDKIYLDVKKASLCLLAYNEFQHFIILTLSILY